MYLFLIGSYFRICKVYKFLIFLFNFAFMICFSLFVYRFFIVIFVVYLSVVFGVSFLVCFSFGLLVVSAAVVLVGLSFQLNMVFNHLSTYFLRWADGDCARLWRELARGQKWS